MRKYKIKWGKFLILRWILVSWILQAIHVLDKKEKLFRIVIEFILIIPAIFIFYFGIINLLTLSIYVVIVHMIFWLFNSTWLVGYREVNKNFKGKGIQSIIDFSKYIQTDIKNCDYNAILLYGSLSRKKYHNRSDLDIRIIRSSEDSIKLFFKGIKYRAIGIWKYKIPIDLKIVDSMEYLKKEMRDDEQPIVISRKPSFTIYNKGDTFQSLIKFPNNYIK